MDNHFTIGELAEYQDISKQTLIYYDSIDLFKPAYVDPSNGYRYYSFNQIDYLDTILIMKRIGFSLKEIKAYMEDSSIETSLSALRNQIEVIERQISELSLIRSRLVHRCSQMERAGSDRDRGIVREHTEGISILCEDVDAPYSPGDISVATKKCFARAFAGHLPIFFQTGVRVPVDRVRDGRFDEASEAFLTIESCGDAHVRDLPAGDTVSLCHYGSWDSMGSSYDALMRYCDDEGLEIVSDSYEFCINDYITSSNENEFITKIVFYVR